LRRLLGDLPPVPTSDVEEAWRRLEPHLPEPRQGIETWLRVVLAGLAVTGLALSLSLIFTSQRRSGLLEAQAAQAELHPLAGTVALAADHADPQPLLQTEPVAEGSRIVTQEGEASLRIADGSRALVEPNSTLRVQRLQAGAVELDLGAGAVSIHAAHLKSGELAVRAGLYRVVVHGTSFRVVREADQLGVQLWHGSVEVFGASGSRFLQPGEQIWIVEGQPVDQAVVLPLSAPEASGWLDEDRPAQRASGHGAREATSSGRSQAPRTPAARIHADVERCRKVADPPPSGVLRLDLSVSDQGQVQSASAERGDADPRVASCVAEAALSWTLDAPPEALRGMQTRLQFVYPIKLGSE
jgi:ferric-dicitrate binding protein FerR (iron transport regulator)